jgi:hypothetical protein
LSSTNHGTLTRLSPNVQSFHRRTTTTSFDRINPHPLPVRPSRVLSLYYASLPYIITPATSSFFLQSIQDTLSSISRLWFDRPAAIKRAAGFQLPTSSDFKTITSIRLFFSPIIGREPLNAAMNQIYGGRLPFLRALYTDTATQDTLASSAYADLRTAIVTLVTGIASKTLDASRIVQIVDKRQLLVLFDPVNPGFIRPCNLCSGAWRCHGPPLYLRSWRLFRSLCRPASILRSLC